MEKVVSLRINLCDVCFESGENQPLWNMGLSGACSQRTGSDAHLYYKTANRNVSGDGCTVYQHDRKRSAVVSGRTNEWYPESYEDLIQKMILDWRAHWKQEELPFIVIQLPEWITVEMAHGQSFVKPRKCSKTSRCGSYCKLRFGRIQMICIHLIKRCGTPCLSCSKKSDVQRRDYQ